MLKLQELKRSLFGPNPKEIIRFCGVATFVQRLKRQYLFIKWPWNVFRLYLSCLTVVLVEIAPVVVYLRERTCQRVWRQNSSFSLSHDFRLLLNDFHGGELCERSVFFETLLTAELHWNVKSRVNWLSSNKQWKDMQLVIFCICSLCSPRVTPSYLFSLWTDRASCTWWDPTLDMLSLGFGTKQRSLQRLKAHQRLVYLYQQKLQGIGGSMEEFSPATWEIRVQFPANARTASF